jgi:dipeptidyl aminopeptidase/acylaminoacyl peptidase
MMNNPIALVFLLSLALSGCAISPIHPELKNAALTPLIPVRDFVANRDSVGGHQISPDGKRIAWSGAIGTAAGVIVKTVGSNEEKQFKISHRYFRWTSDSKHLVIVADPIGDENTHVLVASINGPSYLTNLTPYPKTVSHVLQVIEGGAEVVIRSNRRDKRRFDLYRLNVQTKGERLIATNPGNVIAWLVDNLGAVRARVAIEGGNQILQIPEDGALSAWRTTARWERLETINIFAVDKSSQSTSAWAVSNRGRDRFALVKVDLLSGTETLVFDSPKVDVNWVTLGRKTQQPMLAQVQPDYPQPEIFDERLRARLKALNGGKPADLFITSMDDEERTFTISVATDKGSKNYLLRDGAEPELLGQTRLSVLAPMLSDTVPIAYKARDGLEIQGYLTRPKGAFESKRLPMVLLVHGGPWIRDDWAAGGTNRSLQQFFANRGYAVLQVNYRGSGGYGRSFMAKGMGEIAGKMHDDLIDGVNWAVQNGTADAQKVAIYGASYGGFSALLGATKTPEVFACAIDVVGVADWATLLESAPVYWELDLWYRFVGDPKKPEERKVLDSKSPLYMAASATKPILIMHGVNDTRVKIDQSDRMVEALRKAGKEVRYVTFKGDGHGNQKWTNNLTMYRESEDFLAKCLGGRSSGFDYYQLGAWAF